MQNFLPYGPITMVVAKQLISIQVRIKKLKLIIKTLSANLFHLRTENTLHWLRRIKKGFPNLVMVDVDTSEVQTFPVQFIGTNIVYFPQWSPKGGQIAMTIFNPNPSLMVLNKDFGKIELQYQMDGVAEWKWSDNGEQILILKLDYGTSELCTVSSAQLEIVSLKDKSIKLN